MSGDAGAEYFGGPTADQLPARTDRAGALHLIGAGGLGHALGFVALTRRLVAPTGLTLFDLSPGRAAGVAQDLDEAAVALGLGRGVRGGSGEELLAGAARIVVCAGYPPTVATAPGDLTRVNAKLGSWIGRLLGAQAPEAELVLVATTPCQEVAAALAAAAGWEAARVHPAWTAAAEARELELARLGGCGTSRYGAALALADWLAG